jgi:hypothetical protein
LSAHILGNGRRVPELPPGVPIHSLCPDVAVLLSFDLHNQWVLFSIMSCFQLNDLIAACWEVEAASSQEATGAVRQAIRNNGSEGNGWANRRNRLHSFCEA